MHFLRKPVTLISFGFLLMISERFTVASGFQEPERKRVLQEIQSDYNDCNKGMNKLKQLQESRKHCYGYPEGCVETKDCTLLATIDFRIKDHVEITASHQCWKWSGMFLSAVVFKLEGRVMNGGVYSECDGLSTDIDYRIYQFKLGWRCIFSESNPKREHYVCSTVSQNSTRGELRPGEQKTNYTYNYYRSVAVTNGLTSLTEESPQKVQSALFSSLLPNALQYEGSFFHHRDGEFDGYTQYFM